MSLNAVQEQAGKDGERARLFPAAVTGYSNGRGAPQNDVEQPSNRYAAIVLPPSCCWLFDAERSRVVRPAAGGASRERHLTTLCGFYFNVPALEIRTRPIERTLPSPAGRYPR